MLVDAAKQKEQDLGLENLINIPIDLSDERGILKDKTSNEPRNQVEHNPTRGKGGRKRWKRLIGNENVNLSRHGAQENNAGKGGMKRQWTLQDEEDDISEELLSSKRLKGQKMVQAGNSHEVGVASVKWSQMDQ